MTSKLKFFIINMKKRNKIASAVLVVGLVFAILGVLTFFERIALTGATALTVLVIGVLLIIISIGVISKGECCTSC